MELDGWEFHSSRERLIADRDRDTHMLALGLQTVRITWERLMERPDREAGRLKRILEARQA